jgi:hypothetical protein
MLRKLLALVVGVAALSMVTLATAQEKGEKKTLEGKLVCGKCKLSETEKCSNVLVVKDGDKEVKYYFKDKGKAEKYHKCSGEKDVKVTGKVSKVKEDGKEKNIISDAKVEDKK